EIVGLLPADDAALITGDTPGPERDALIDNFKAQRFRYLVNVSVLTTGFDAPHVDLIAILRPTESVSLYQQIVGRGLRLEIINQRVALGPWRIAGNQRRVVRRKQTDNL
ncbi:hypothetical protein ACH54_03675, partial [Salmonella enterica subsp. enterica serovar Infantis]